MKKIELLLPHNRTNQSVCLEELKSESKDMEEFLDTISEQESDNETDSDADDEMEINEREVIEDFVESRNLIENNSIIGMKIDYKKDKENLTIQKKNAANTSILTALVDKSEAGWSVKRSCFEDMTNAEHNDVGVSCKSAVGTHQRDTHKDCDITCTLCYRHFPSKPNLNVHKVKVNAIDNHRGKSKTLLISKCPICLKSFQRQNTLDLHMEIHLGTQKFTCNVCNAMFSRKHDLIRHFTRHSGDKPYKCELCDKRYRMPGDLGRHRNSVHGRGNVCDVCGKKYVREFDLKQHKSRHHNSTQSSQAYDIRDDTSGKNTMKTDRQIHICPYCDKSFSTSSNRSKHVRRLHSNASFKCDTCSKEFKAKYDLSYHVKTVHKFI